MKKYLILIVAGLLAVVGAGLLLFRGPTLGYSESSHPCVVEGGVTILCQRTEDARFVYYKTVAVSDGQTILILRQSRKGGEFIEAKH